MTWRYGLIRTYYPDLDEYEYAVHEIFSGISADGGDLWTEEPVGFYGSSRDAVEKALRDALLDISGESDEAIESRGH